MFPHAEFVHSAVVQKYAIAKCPDSASSVLFHADVLDNLMLPNIPYLRDMLSVDPMSLQNELYHILHQRSDSLLEKYVVSCALWRDFLLLLYLGSLQQTMFSFRMRGFSQLHHRQTLLRLCVHLYSFYFPLN